MKSLYAAMFALLAVGCHGQVPPATVYTCPPTSGTAYTALNTSTATTATNYTDATPGAGSWCYIAQAKASNGGVSVPSNVAQVAPTATQSVSLTWTASANCASCVYIISRSAAVSFQPTAPALNAPTVAMNEVLDPTLVADLKPLKLKAVAR